jgi:hypothetical protein
MLRVKYELNHIRAGRQQSMFERHVASCSLQNWKYWVFSRIMQPLLFTYDE